MPIYEYSCTACGKRSTALLESFATPNPACPHCGKTALKRLVSTFATSRSDDAGADWGDDFDAGMSGGEDLDGGGDEGFGGGEFGGGDDFDF